MTDVNVLSSGGDALVQTFTQSRDHCELHLRGLGTGSLEPMATQLHHCSSKVASRCVAGKRSQHVCGTLFMDTDIWADIIFLCYARSS